VLVEKDRGVIVVEPITFSLKKRSCILRGPDKKEEAPQASKHRLDQDREFRT